MNNWDNILQNVKGKRKVESLGRVRLFVTPWTIAYKAPLSMGFSRQGCRSGLPFPSPEDLPDPEIEPGSPTLQADALPFEPQFIFCQKPVLIVHFLDQQHQQPLGNLELQIHRFHSRPIELESLHCTVKQSGFQQALQKFLMHTEI